MSSNGQPVVQGAAKVRQDRHARPPFGTLSAGCHRGGFYGRSGTKAVISRRFDAGTSPVVGWPRPRPRQLILRNSQGSVFLTAAKKPPKSRKRKMSILLAIVLFAGVLLALDLLTAPKYSDRARTHNLKESRRAA
jgi:hypothetical protein